MSVGWAALGVAVIGVALWLFGSRYGRSLVTLAGVAGGAALGLKIPSWLNIDIRNWATAVGGALVLGLLGYVLYRFLVRAGLSLLLAFWAALACCMLFGTPDWKPPEMTDKILQQHDSSAMQQFGQDFWKSIPDDLKKYAPIAVGAGLVGGLAIGIFLGRLAMAMFYSVVGVTLIAFGSLEAISLLRPGLLDSIPQDSRIQLEVLLGAAAFGTLVQWILAPRPGRSPPPPPEPAPQAPGALPPPLPPPVPRGDAK